MGSSSSWFVSQLAIVFSGHFFIVGVGILETVAGEFALLDNDNLLHCSAI